MDQQSFPQLIHQKRGVFPIYPQSYPPKNAAHPANLPVIGPICIPHMYEKEKASWKERKILDPTKRAGYYTGQMNDALAAKMRNCRWVVVCTINWGPDHTCLLQKRSYLYSMPKVTKRAETKRAAKIAKYHNTALPELPTKEPVRRAPGIKPPARGLARYPWAVGILVILIFGSVATLYFTRTGPFAPAPKSIAQSPCNASTVVKQLTNTAAAPTSAQFAKIVHTYAKAPAMSIDVNKVYCVGLNTSRGLIVLELDPKDAPNTVNNFVYLAQHQFYDGLKFHRVVPGFVIQTGDPKGNGSGGPGYKFNDEPVKGDYTQGCVAMANSGPNTNGSQFFICTANDTSKLPTKSYNLFGHVTLGMNVAQAIKGPGDDASTKNIPPDTLKHVVVVAVNP